jgi:dTDP-4-dehydrorhamnose reductase
MPLMQNVKFLTALQLTKAPPKSRCFKFLKDRASAVTSRLLVTGAGGFLGRQLCVYGGASVFAVVGRARSRLTSMEPLGIESAVAGDLSDAKFVHELIAQSNPSVVIHAAALANPAQCEQDPEQSLQANVRSAYNLAQVCAQLKSAPRLIFISSEQVFSGRVRKAYKVHDKCEPINVYGAHKALAEQQLQALYPSTTIVRLPLLYGSINPQCTKINQQNNSDPICFEGMGFVGGVVRELLAGQEVRAFSDEFRPPAHVDDVAQALVKLARLDDAKYRTMPKILHLGGPHVLNRFQMSVEIALELKRLGRSIESDLIRSVTRASLEQAHLRPEYLDLESAQSWLALDITPRTFAKGLRSLSSSI